MQHIDFRIALALSLVIGTGATSVTTVAAEEASNNIAEIMVINPVMATTCLAVKVEVIEGQLVEGLMWYNNDAETVFPYVLAASGFDGEPPHYADTLVLVENVTGSEDGWSELHFGQGVTSETGVFYVVFQFPPFAETTGRGVGPGLGYEATENGSSVFFSAEGESWVRLITSQKMLVEPIYVDDSAKSGGKILVLPNPTESRDGEAGEEINTEEKGEVVVVRTKLGVPYPNPFNPMTKIPFALKDSGPVVLTVYDLRGRQVRRFDLGHKVSGMHEVIWQGVDDNGRFQPSGVYFARMEAGGVLQTQRLVLVR